MRRSALALIAASSLLIFQVASAATRPHYGGTLRVAVSAAPVSLDPLDLPDSVAGANISRLLFDTLVELDDRGAAQPGLAASWESEPGRQRWQFHLRAAVTFDDGTPFTAEAAAASLRAANPGWRVSAAGDAVVIERDSPDPGLPAELALPRNSIAKRGAGKLYGTGPFTVAHWDAGKKLVLTAREDYWLGRPFLNSIDIDLGKGLREQLVSFDLGKLDLVEVAPEQARQAVAEGRRVAASAPVNLVALVFARERQSPEEGRLREALSLSIDRGALNNVLLRGGGEPSASLLPNWMTGYSLIFPVTPDPERARQMHTGVPQPALWTLSYDAADPVARLMAERIALNARDAGLSLQPVSTGAADVRLVQIHVSSLDSRAALLALASSLGLPRPKYESDSAQDLYAAESMLLQSQRVIPLLHLRINYGMTANVRNWIARPDGSWALPDVWLGSEKP